MRRIVSAILLAALVATTAAAPAGARSADPVADDPSAFDLPEGFLDGEPVGGTELPPAEGEPVPEGEEVPDGDGIPEGEVEPEGDGGGFGTMSINTRYFGSGPWNAIRSAAAATPRPTGCSLSNDALTALVAAPIFKESSAATTPSSAPSPMTLSRYDEWNGVYSTNSNAAANYTLYEGRNPHTPYHRAYWHPGIGIWQYDSAGVGAPFTAIERMDVNVVARDVAAGMAARYCNPPSSIVGHSRPPTVQERRNAAWWPWWTGNTNRQCPLCQREYGHMTASAPFFANVSIVSGISATGGAVQRSCTVSGGARVPCWYVNPSVGVIQGATAWATLNPDGGARDRAPAPLSRPFYVIKRNGMEERHWLRADTGYPVDISARRQLGRNARVRSNQAGSGLAWTRTSGLCDVTTGRGACAATPPPTPPTPPAPPAPPNPIPAPSGITSARTTVNGTYRPVVFDRSGNGRGDILWHGPGRSSDSLWLGQGSGRFSYPGITINNAWDEIIPADINGDGREDLIFYNRSSGEAALWIWNADGTFRSQRINPGPRMQPLVGDFTGDGRTNVFWYRAGRTGAYWGWNGTSVTVTPRTVQGSYQPLVGDFDGNGIDDIFWYGPGSAPDSMWLHQRGGAIRAGGRAVHGTYRPFVGDFDGDGSDDIVWYQPGGPNSVWFDFTGSRLVTQPFTITTNYQPVVADLQGDGRDDIIWYDPTSATGHLWTRWSAGRVRSSVAMSVPAGLQPLVGPFSASGRDGIFWYGPGNRPDAVWYR